jgi:hypothetical protein
MENLISQIVSKVLLEQREPSMPLIVKLFKMLNEEKKKNKTRASLIQVIENYAPYMNIPPEYALYLLELYVLNYRKDGDYSGLTKGNFIDPRKQQGKTTSNPKAKLYTIAQLPFKGSNLIGRWSKDYNGKPYYEVVSYNWYPVYIFKDDKWYEVNGRYSSSTSKQMSNANPVKWEDELQEVVYLLSQEEMKMLRQGATHEEVMKHKLKKLKEFEPELTKRKKTAKSHRWFGGDDEVQFADANIKFKIKSVDNDGDKATVEVDILDVIRRDDGKEVQTPQNYLKGEMQGMNKERAEERVKVKIMDILRDYMATRFRYNGEDPPIQNIFFKFNHLKK